jgi:glutamate 5-kinase
LSVVDGLLDPEGKPIRLVDQVAGTHALVRAEKSPLGKGGFGSKLEAARMVSDSGEALVIADGRSENVLPRLLDGDELGTLFLPAGRKLSSRSRWIGSVRPAGTVVVDEGAARALVEQHRSLLPAGIVAVDGTFARGDVVAIQFGDVVIGRGLCNYSAEQVERIRGKHTQAVRELLAESAYDEVIHRDNLVIEKSPGQ